MLVQILLSSVTMVCALAQRMPIMPPTGTSSGNQDTVSFPELIALMAMRNQLPTGDQTYSLLNLTGGNPLPSLPPTPNYPLQTPPVSGRNGLQRTRSSAHPPPPQMSPADIKSAVESAVSAALPSAVQSAVKVAAPVQQQPQMSQVDIQAAVQSAINSALPSAVQTATAAASDQSSPAMSPAGIQSAINSAVKAALAAKPPSSLDIQSMIKSGLAANQSMKASASAPSLDIQSMIKAALKSTSAGSSKPKFTGPPPACSGSCPPKWLATVKGFTGILKPGNPMCKFTKFISPCDTPNSPCKPGYSCCPKSCLTTVVDCHQGPPIEYSCLPDDITPWWPEMVQTYMQAHGMGAAGSGMGAGMGGGGMMGGLMGGLMGGMGGMMGFR